jgi:hypothetical protein
MKDVLCPLLRLMLKELPQLVPKRRRSYSNTLHPYCSVFAPKAIHID